MVLHKPRGPKPLTISDRNWMKTWLGPTAKRDRRLWTGSSVATVAVSNHLKWTTTSVCLSSPASWIRVSPAWISLEKKEHPFYHFNPSKLLAVISQRSPDLQSLWLSFYNSSRLVATNLVPALWTNLKTFQHLTSLRLSCPSTLGIVIIFLSLLHWENHVQNWFSWRFFIFYLDSITCYPLFLARNVSFFLSSSWIN